MNDWHITFTRINPTTKERETFLHIFSTKKEAQDYRQKAKKYHNMWGNLKESTGLNGLNADTIIFNEYQTKEKQS